MTNKDCYQSLPVDVGGDDEPVIRMNKEAFDQLTNIKDNNKKKIVIVPGATHHFQEPGKLEKAARLATNELNQSIPWTTSNTFRGYVVA